MISPKSEDQTFLSAIAACPEDLTAKLVYADWLDERNDHRAEIVRLKVRIATSADDYTTLLVARKRLAELEPTVPLTWLVVLDGPVWCISGNIVASHPFGPNGDETRHGTRLFRPSAKVYLADLSRTHSFLIENPTPYDRIRVVGRHRMSSKWISCMLRSSYTTNWRVELVYQPGILARLKREDWPGFNINRGSFACPKKRDSRETIQMLLDLLR